MKELQHLSMLYPADNEHGFIQCVIKPQYRDAFQELGFVDHIDRLEKKDKKDNSQHKLGKSHDRNSR